MRYAFLILFPLLLAFPACAQDEPHNGADHASMVHEAGKKNRQHQTVKLELLPVQPLEAGRSVHVIALLTFAKDGKPVPLDGLKLSRTKKVHLLIIDPSLTDFHHAHPIPGENPGEYVFDFSPQKKGIYRAWADITPVATGQQEYVRADMGIASREKTAIDKTLKSTATVNGYNFTLLLNDDLKAGESTLAEISVSKDDKPVTQLEPVLGAFSYVVGFNDDYRNIVKVHPLGQEAKVPTDRFGPDLEFRIEPKAPGFVKLFAQVRIDGRDITVPFGVMVH